MMRTPWGHGQFHGLPLRLHSKATLTSKTDIFADHWLNTHGMSGGKKYKIPIGVQRGVGQDASWRGIAVASGTIDVCSAPGVRDLNVDHERSKYHTVRLLDNSFGSTSSMPSCGDPDWDLNRVRQRSRRIETM